MYVTHFRKDNSEEYSKLEKIQIVKVENDTSPQTERTLEDLEQALKGKFVTCNVQYRDKKTDVLFCNVFIQNPPEGF
jgi:regulator of replication initiation timing